MTGRCWPSRVLIAALCYVYLVQMFLAAYGIALATLGHASVGADFAICYGTTGNAPDKEDTKAKLPCALCTVTAAGRGLPPDPIAMVVPPVGDADLVRLPDVIVIVSNTPPRAGQSRAPPSLA